MARLYQQNPENDKNGTGANGELIGGSGQDCNPRPTENPQTKNKPKNPQRGNTVRCGSKGKAGLRMQSG